MCLRAVLVLVDDFTSCTNCANALEGVNLDLRCVSEKEHFFSCSHVLCTFCVISRSCCCTSQTRTFLASDSSCWLEISAEPKPRYVGTSWAPRSKSLGKFCPRKPTWNTRDRARHSGPKTHSNLRGAFHVTSRERRRSRAFPLGNELRGTRTRGARVHRTVRNPPRYSGRTAR